MKVTINGWPVTARFGSIDPAHLMPHKGVDFGIPVGTPVPSIGDGVVTSVTNEGARSFGLAVHVRMRDGTDVIYGHLSSANVTPGQRIRVGDIIAYSGNTGDSTGPHLHLQAMVGGVPVDPMTQLQSQPSKFDQLMRMWNFCDDVNKNGWFHAITGHQAHYFVGEALQSVGTLCLGGFLITFPIACFGIKLGRKWAIRFVCGYLILTVAGAAVGRG